MFPGEREESVYPARNAGQNLSEEHSMSEQASGNENRLPISFISSPLELIELFEIFI